MSTKSIFKDVVVDNSALCSKLVSVLERSVEKKSNQVVISKKVTTITQRKRAASTETAPLFFYSPFCAEMNC